MFKMERYTTHKTLANSDTLTRHMLLNPDGSRRMIYEIGQTRRMHVFLREMQKAIEAVAMTHSPPWTQSLINGTEVNFVSPDARAFWLWVIHADDELLEMCEGRRLNPWLKLGVRIAQKWGPRLRGFTSPHDRKFSPSDRSSALLQRMFRLVRKVARSKMFRDEIKAQHRRSNATYVACAEFMLEVLKYYSRPLILRIDLYFEGDAKVISESDAANAAHEKFLRRVREGRVIYDRALYISVREDGLDRCIHYHVLIVMDGHKYQNGYLLTKMLGDDWENNCVGSSTLGSTKNCWERRSEYLHNGLGLLHYSDEEMLLGVRDALAYMAKLGKMPHLLVRNGMGKNLRKSLPPRTREGSAKLGAPRHSDTSLDLARKILLGSGHESDQPKEMLDRLSA